MKVESRFAEPYTGKITLSPQEPFSTEMVKLVRCAGKYCTAVIQQESEPHTSMIW